MPPAPRSRPLPPVVPAPIQTSLPEMAAALRAQVQLLGTGVRTWQIPALKKRYQPAAGMHYHFCPEIFVLTGGLCDFTFAAQRFAVRAGQVCVVPGGIPHSERVRRSDADYRAVIVNFYNKTIYVHGAHDDGHGFPACDNMYFFTSPLYADAITILNRICELNDDNPAAHEVAIRSLLTGTLALLAQMFEAPQAQPSPVQDIVSRCQWLVKRHASNDALDLAFLARELDLSPSHLSHVFRRKTGERLNDHIVRIRIQNALDGLRATQLSVKSIGAACGFADASYFCRVFRKVTGLSPQDYRTKETEARLALERRPKTVLAEGASFVGGGVYAPLALTELNVFDALRCTRLSIKSIATGSGFRDEASFVKHFQAATGQTPDQYRTDSQRGDPPAGLAG